MCPITTQVKDYPYEVELPSGLAVGGVILADQIKSMDWEARGAQYAATLPDHELKQVLGKLATLLR